MKLFLVFIAMACISCKTKNIPSSNQSTSLELIAKGNLHGAGAEGIEKQTTVINNESDWNDLLKKMNSVNKVTRAFLETEIDFSKHRVIAVFDEVKGNGGHSLELNVHNKLDEIIIDVIYKSTDSFYQSPEGVATTVISQPYYLVKIENTNKAISFN